MHLKLCTLESKGERSLANSFVSSLMKCMSALSLFSKQRRNVVDSSVKAQEICMSGFSQSCTGTSLSSCSNKKPDEITNTALSKTFPCQIYESIVLIYVLSFSIIHSCPLSHCNFNEILSYKQLRVSSYCKRLWGKGGLNSLE